MAGASKKRARTEKKSSRSSNESSAGSTPKSIPRLDGNRDPIPAGGNRVPTDYTNNGDLKNISEFLGAAGWCAARGLAIPKNLPVRPKFNTWGKETTLTLNTFNVIKAPQKIVYQYDVAWGHETDITKRVLIKKIWNSKAVKSALGEPKNFWIYDGNKLAWSGKDLGRNELRINVDLDAEEGRTSKKPNKHTVFMRQSRTVDFHHLQAFLDGLADWSPDCIDTINFVDHLLREYPSQRYTQIRKSFFQRAEEKTVLGYGVEAMKGVFASLRPVLDDKLEKGLAINVDVHNGSFWRPQPLIKVVGDLFGGWTYAQIGQRFVDARVDWKNSFLKRDLRRLKRVGIVTQHMKENKTWIIDEIDNKMATEHAFADPENPGKMITVHQYFVRKYNIRLHMNLPLVKVTKKIRGEPVYFPMDVLRVDVNQRYNAKLNEEQTSQMIKFAVTVPKDRWAAIQYGLGLLNWPNDPYLNHYGLKISPTPSKVKARILPHPTVVFGPGGQAQLKPTDTIAGRWRLDGRKFAMNNKDRPITAWGVCVVEGKHPPSQVAVQNFIKNFVTIYEGHGGVFTAHPVFGKTPWLGLGKLADGGELVAKAWNATGNRYNQTPMLMIFIVNDKNIEVYRRIKKSCDLRFGVASQVLQARHVTNNSPQYVSNVCLKINAKLGGATCVAKSNIIPRIAPKGSSLPTMVVGADVSHPAPGALSGEAASFAAITVSADQFYVKYWADVQTNGNRIEMITTRNIKEHFGPMVKMWMERLGKGLPPKRLVYIRDGVAENQYAAVLAEEVRDMKEVFLQLGCRELPDFTVVIAGKRHHIRFFPDAGKGDRNGNPIPGTLVENGCTHPFEFDFYLCSHVAIKGTARPIHYQCILNEGDWLADELQSFIFEHSYQYVRSTTPVSLHPAVYYAHLAADRSRAHTNASPVSSGKKEQVDRPPTTISSGAVVEIPPLVPLNNTRRLKQVMWFV